MDTLPEKFCAFPFYLSNIENDGKVSLCRSAQGKIAQHTRPLSLHTETFEQIWNSDHMRGIRRRMLAGEEVEACRGCSAREAAGRRSPRQDSRSRDRVGMQVDNDLELLEKARFIVDRQQGIAPPPSELHLWLGNLCNMTCRTCSAAYSSQIAADPVHSDWMGPLVSTQTLLPDFLGGVEYIGFGRRGAVSQTPTRALSSQNATILLPGHPASLAWITIEGFKRSRLPCCLAIRVGESLVARRWLFGGPWQISVQPETSAPSGELSVSLSTSGFWQDIEISQLRLATKGTGGKKPPPELVSRIRENPSWFRSEQLVFGELLRHPQDLRQVVFSGGEPLINPMLPIILQRLVNEGYPEQTGIYFTTNGTVYSRALSELCRRFRVAEIGFSLDGVGSVQEYIRPPAKWNRIERNLLAFRDDGIPVSVRPSVQAYNVFDLLDLLRFCDQQHIPFILDNLLSNPQFLSLDMLPESVIAEALTDWTNYLETECLSGNRTEVAAVIATLRSPRLEAAELAILQDEFIRFTNDLDKSRAEDFAAACPRLHRSLMAAGFRFQGKYRFMRRRSLARRLLPNRIRSALRRSFQQLEDHRRHGSARNKWLLQQFKWIRLRFW